VARAWIDPKWAALLEDWVLAGHHGSMRFLAETLETRKAVSAWWPEARSVLCVAASYPPAAQAPPTEEGVWGRVSGHACGRDYHRAVSELLEDAVHEVQQLLGVSLDHRVCVDTAPVMERALALSCGLGRRGKNGCLMVEGVGSRVVLGEVFFSSHLEADPPLPGDSCEGCDRCVQACPTGALLGDGRMDAGRCLAYLSIEHKGLIPQKLASAMGDRVFGCDTCLDVCPRNEARRSDAGSEASSILQSLRPSDPKKIEEGWLCLTSLARLPTGELRRKLAPTGLERLTPSRLRRNLCIVCGNTSSRRARRVLEGLAKSRSNLVSRQARQALGDSSKGA
jgi:epoxyqueuosine reductase